MRDYKQMQEIQRLREESARAESDPESASEGTSGEREKDRYGKRKPGFRGWASYVYEYYKWPILIGLVILFGIGAGISQLRRAANPDLAVMYVGPFYLSPSYQTQLEEQVAFLSGEEIAGDYNGDGEYKFSLLDITVDYLTDSQGVQYLYDDGNSALTRFQTEIRAGDALLYFLEPYYYRQAKAEGILQPLEALGETYAAKSFDGYGVYLGDLDGYLLDGFSRMPARTVVCLRRSPEEDSITYGRTVKDWEHHRDLFCRLLDYTDGAAADPNEGCEPDVTLLVVGETPVLRSIRRPMEALLSEKVADGNGDGKRVGQVKDFLRSGTEAARALRAKEVRTELVTGNSMVWILDEEAFLYAKEKGLLAPLPEEFAGRENAVDGCALRLYALDIYAAEGFCELYSNSYLCLRRSPETETESYGRTQEAYERAKDVFTALVNYEYVKEEG